MALYILPSIFAISAKIAVLMLSRRRLLSVERSLLVFLIGLFSVNVFELALFIFAPYPDTTFVFLLLYYGGVIIASGAWMHYVLSLKKWLSPLTKRVIHLLHGLAFIVLLIPGAMLEGAESIGYSITRIPGPFYPFLQLLITAGLGVTVTALVFARRDPDADMRKKALVLMVATWPLMVSVAVVLLLMQLGVAVNATIITSLATSFMMAVLIFTESKYRLFQFLTVIPNTAENRQWTALASLLSKRDISLKEAQTLFSALFVEEAVKRSAGNQVQAAKSLSTSRTTIHRYLKNNTKERNVEQKWEV